MSPITLAGIYLLTTILIVDIVYRTSLQLRGRLVAAMPCREAGNVTYMLGLLPPMAGLLSATAFSLLVPLLALGGYLWSNTPFADAATGLGLGVLCAGVTIAVCAATGLMRTTLPPKSEWKLRSTVFGLVGVDLLICATFEEVVFRGQLLQVLQQSFSPISAVAISAGIFGLVHIWKQRNAPMIWAFNTAAFGFLAGLLVLTTGNLISSIVLHFVWNMVQTPLLGLPANGAEYDHGLLKSETHGPAVLTGGSWSLDAGLISSASLLAGIALLLFIGF